MLNVDSWSASEEDAAKRAELYKDFDPFPEIECSILNSADIVDYVRVTGMIFPFYQNELNPASYAVSFLGECIFWDESGKKHSIIINKDEDLLLKSDSLIYVSLEPTFRFPNYLTSRFNLKINHVYRGLLLGTGPLVDPGYEGKLYVPIHNFTTNDYILHGGETLIWMEFNKVSRRDLNNISPDGHRGEKLNREGKFKSFNSKKKNRSLSNYLKEAEPHRPISSSIPQAIKKAVNASVKAQKKVNFLTIASLAVLIAVLSFMAVIFYNSMAYVRNARQDFENDRLRLDSQLITIKLQVDSLKKQNKK